MNEEERHRLIYFLQQMVQTRTTQVDQVALNMIHDAIKNQPMHAYFLVQRAMFLEQQINQFKSLDNQTTDFIYTGDSPFFDPHSNSWGKNLLVKNVNTNFLNSPPQARKLNRLDFEEHAINFLGNNAGKVWIVIAVVAYIVVTYR